MGLRIEIRGTVQGVGFRPWVYRVAHEVGVAGRVRNHARGVTVEAFGDDDALARLVARLREPVPPARVRELATEPIADESVDDFVIEHSAEGGARALSIPPDLATCPDCEREIRDAADRRFHYAFTNCTACGPRFTIATGVPYDRPATTMAPFGMCPSCRREYHDPSDRRFHAQPNACPACGPKLSLWATDGAPIRVSDPILAVAQRIADGQIVAIKGLGGFHLACDAARDDSIATLRRRKHRDEKPFAVMVKDLATARAMAVLSREDEALLASPERPIVLVPRRAGAPLSRAIAPETDLVGLMLPYTPLHHLLLRAVDRALVMTSANPSDEPICADNTEAVARLGSIADVLLVHDRAIATRCDDSVARVIAGHPTLLRRSRGYVPRPIALTRAVAKPVLAVGAQLKNTFCVAVGDSAYLGPHVGDLETEASLAFFESAIARMEDILCVRPEVIAHDLHPGYLSTQYARTRASSARLVAVQHHHAHVASAMAEHGLAGPVIGVAYDGTGWGTDGTAWGGEILVADFARFERVATFRPVALAGGDAAIREPWRIALALVDDALGADVPHLPVFAGVPAKSIAVVRGMLAAGVNAPLARGIGRFFDGIGALALARTHATYEGQLAVAWNLAAADGDHGVYPYALDGNAIESPGSAGARSNAKRCGASIESPGSAGARSNAKRCGASIESPGSAGARSNAKRCGASIESPGSAGARSNAKRCAVTIDLRPLVRAVVRDLGAHVPASVISARFHDTLVAATADRVRAAVATHGRLPVVLTGGAFQNPRLAEGLARNLADLDVYLHGEVPPGDGGIALGQAMIGDAIARGHT